jgi:protein HIRA/HIR1
MIIEKLTWAASKSKDPINAVDIHRDGSRFVTCQGNRIYIWRMQGLEVPENEEKHIVKSTDDTEISVSMHVFNAVHQFVCELKVHQKPVNCVRFSPNGLYLAASSDDGVVSLYKLEKSPTQLDVNKTEDWRCIKLFKEHVQDVLGVEWSPDSKLLASCSVDNKIIIYDIEKKEKLKEMVGEGFVNYHLGKTFCEYFIFRIVTFSSVCETDVDARWINSCCSQCSQRGKFYCTFDG